MSSQRANVAGVEVGDQNWLIYATPDGRGNLAYRESSTPNETERRPYKDQKLIRVGRNPVKPDPGSPIAAASFPGNGTEVRVFYFEDSYLRELLYNTQEDKWAIGALTEKDITADPASGLSAAHLGGYLKVYLQEASSDNFIVWYTPINQDKWDRNSVGKN